MNDTINALFELGGSLLIWLNVRTILKDKVVKGVFWPVNVFYTLWGVWNMYYYPSLGQSWSFWAGIGVVVGNAVWCVAAWKYRPRKSAIRTFPDAACMFCGGSPLCTCPYIYRREEHYKGR